MIKILTQNGVYYVSTLFKCMHIIIKTLFHVLNMY